VYRATACLTPAGPCVSESGPNPVVVTVAVVGGIFLLAAGLKFLKEA
jgi:hypothetical protein